MFEYAEVETESTSPFFKLGGEMFRGSNVVWYSIDKDKLGTTLEYQMDNCDGLFFEFVVTEKELVEFLDCVGR